MPVDLDRALAALVLERPSAARVLEHLGLDYCCGGQRSLRDACRERGLDPGTVAVFLAHAEEPVALEPTDWTRAPLAELCAHIVDEHHRRLRWELPRLRELAERVALVHGEAEPQVCELRAELESLCAELEEHIATEERELFPLLSAGYGLARRQLESLVHDHETTGERLRRLRLLADDYDTRTALCTTHRALLQ
ncbi:MAG TPA: DUF542 domain-containing protein, partial [Gaiellaceae bacterium]|nr:DUF542 domain-containing protein [Gaiellaceae bacterium]